MAADIARRFFAAYNTPDNGAIDEDEDFYNCDVCDNEHYIDDEACCESIRNIQIEVDELPIHLTQKFWEINLARNAVTYITERFDVNVRIQTYIDHESNKYYNLIIESPNIMTKYAGKI